MKPSVLLFLPTIMFLVPLKAQHADWSFELHGGAAYSIPLPLIVHQEGLPVIRFNAQYRSRSFDPPFYWVWRIGRSANSRSWEFEAVHHKLYLENKPAEIQDFSISHGYNILTLNRAWEYSAIPYFPFIIRLGGGLVLTHPESIIRDRAFDEDQGIFGMGYYISGPVLNLTAAKRIRLGKRFFINAELKCNPSYALVPVAGGHAGVWNIALEAAAGLGINFLKARNTVLQD